MTREQVFNLWAPEAAAWSRWAKPVLFAFLDAAPQPPPAAAAVTTDMPIAVPMTVPVPSKVDVSRVPAADGSTVVVVDLPGALGVAAGLSLAEAGYRPVPLYNAVPAPGLGSLAPRGAVAVEMAEVLRALRDTTPRLDRLRLRNNAPPAFLLDARRRTGDPAALRPGAFDNRSVSLPTDFPSANLLLAGGVRRAVVLHGATGQPQADLAHTLRRWQDAGVEIFVLAAAAAGIEGDAGLPRPITVDKPRWYRHLWHAMLARLGLRPHPLGGFGGFLPVPSAG